MDFSFFQVSLHNDMQNDSSLSNIDALLYPQHLFHFCSKGLVFSPVIPFMLSSVDPLKSIM